ncbi:MAG: zinc transporter ZntB [Sphingobium sp.]
MSRCFLIDGTNVQELALSQIPSALAPGSFLWVHVDGAHEDAEQLLSSLVTIPPVVLTALLASETRPRASAYEHGALLNMRGLGADNAADGDSLVSIRMWAEQGRVVSLSYRPMAALDRVIAQMLRGNIHDPGDLITAVAMEITEDLDPYIAELGDELDTIESHISDDGKVGVRHRVTMLRAAAISYRRFLAPQRQMLERLVAMPCNWLEPEDRLHIQEAGDRAARMVEELVAVRERAALTHEALTDLRAEHMNKQALVLAIVALIFLPLTFVTGLLGMNVEGIPFAHRPWAFWGVTAFSVAVGGVVGIWFKATRWLQK